LLHFAAQIAPDFVLASPGFLVAHGSFLSRFVNIHAPPAPPLQNACALRYKQFFRFGAGYAMKCLNTRNYWLPVSTI